MLLSEFTKTFQNLQFLRFHRSNQQFLRIYFVSLRYVKRHEEKNTSLILAYFI